MKSWLERNDIEMYSAHNKEKPAVAERFIRTLKNKTYRYMTSISKNVYIDKLDDMVYKFNNTRHNTIKIKPVDVKSSTYIKVIVIVKKIMIKILNLKLGILFEYQNRKTFLQKAMFKIGLKKFL